MSAPAPAPAPAPAAVKDKIIDIIRSDFDQTPKNWEGEGWYDNAEEVADSIVALFASPQTDLVSRAEVLRVIRSLGDQDADLALYGAADNARAREYGEAAATRACCAIALMPPPPPHPPHRQRWSFTQTTSRYQKLTST